MLSLLLFLFLVSPVSAQIACFNYGTTVSCQGPNETTTITEFSPGQGVIRDSDGNLSPYTVMPPRDSHRERRSDNFSLGLEPLESLPTLRDSGDLPSFPSLLPLGLE